MNMLLIYISARAIKKYTGCQGCQVSVLSDYDDQKTAKGHHFMHSGH